MAMKITKKQIPNEFILSKSADKEQDEFVRNSKNPSLILKESCDHMKLKVLKIHPELGEFLIERIKKWVKKLRPDEIDLKHDIYVNLSGITIRRLTESRQWVYFLEAYLRVAANGFYKNFLSKQEKFKDTFEYREDIGAFGKKESKAYTEIILSSSATPMQTKIALLMGEDSKIIREQIAEQLGVSTKTIYRSLKELQNNDLCDELKEKIREEMPSRGDFERSDSEPDMTKGVFTKSLKPKITNHKINIVLREPRKCPQCEKVFLSLYKIKKCKDHDGLEEI